MPSLLVLAALALPAQGPAAAQGAGPGTAPSPDYRPPPAAEGYSYPDCYCTDSTGERVELGETACLSIGSRRVLARCEMAANNPTWRHETEGCPGV